MGFWGKSPQVLVLDEATSALDPKSELEVQEAILKISKKAKGALTIIMIAHRLQTIESAENLLFIESPKVMRAGKKGTKEYNKIMNELKKKNYAHQVQSDDDEQSQQSKDNFLRVNVSRGQQNNSNQSQMSHYSQNSMQMSEASRIESRIIANELERKAQLTAQEKATEEKEKNEQAKIQYKTTFLTKNAGWCRIFSYYKPQIMILVMIVTAIINSAAMPVIGFLVVKVQFTFYSKSEGNENWEADAIQWIIIMSTWLFIVQLLVKATEKAIFTSMGEKMTLAIRIQLIEEIMHKQISWFDREDRAPGIITKTLSGDVALLNGLTAEYIVTLFELMLMIIYGLVGGIYFSWQATIVSFICSPIMLISFYKQATLKWGNKGGRRIDDSEKVSNYEKSNALLSDVVINYRTVISLGQKNVDKICERFEELLDAPIRGLYYGLGNAGRALFISVVFIINIELLVVKWELDSEDIFTGTYLLFFTFMSLGFNASNVPSISKAKQAAVPIFSIIDEPSELDIRQSKQKEKHRVVENGLIQFKNITFNYPTRSTKVLENFDLEIPAGAKIALVGHSGCGKSTLTNILLRFYNLQDEMGKILIDNIDIDEYDVHSLRQQCGYVMQEPVLFNTSIKKNILFGKPDATDEEIYIAALKANALQFIEANLDEQLSKEESESKLNESFVKAFDDLKATSPQIAALYNQIENILEIKDSTTASQFKQMVLDLFKSVDEEILKKADTNSKLFLTSIETVSGKYGASWVDIILNFEWQLTLQQMISSKMNSGYFTKDFEKLVFKTLNSFPDLQGAFDVVSSSNKVMQASEKHFENVQDLADFFREESTNYKMTNVKERYDKLMHMAIDRLRDQSGLFKLHKGFEKECGLKGGKLSGGQKQRVAIARALIKNPRILILDEATSALDEHSQEVVQQALDRAMEGRTSIVIAHRLSTIRNCDILFVLGNGHVLEYGSYDELASDPESHFNVLKAGMEN